MTPQEALHPILDELDKVFPTGDRVELSAVDIAIVLAAAAAVDWPPVEPHPTMRIEGKVRAKTWTLAEVYLGAMKSGTWVPDRQDPIAAKLESHGAIQLIDLRDPVISVEDKFAEETQEEKLARVRQTVETLREEEMEISAKPFIEACLVSSLARYISLHRLRPRMLDDKVTAESRDLAAPYLIAMGAFGWVPDLLDPMAIRLVEAGFIQLTSEHKA